MHFTTSFIIAALPYLSLSFALPNPLAKANPDSANPAHTNTNVFTLTSINKNNEAVHIKPVTARARGLYIGGGQSDLTVFDVNDATTNLLLDSQASVRPAVFLGDDGALNWTPGQGIDAVPKGAVSTGFSLVDPGSALENGEPGGESGDGQVMNLLLGGKEQWLACPVVHASGTYRILSAYKDFVIDESLGPREECIDIALAAQRYPGGLPPSYE